MQTRVERGQASEDEVTGAIERQTSMVHSSLFLGLALGQRPAGAGRREASSQSQAGQSAKQGRRQQIGRTERTPVSVI